MDNYLKLLHQGKQIVTPRKLVAKRLKNCVLNGTLHFNFNLMLVAFDTHC